MLVDIIAGARPNFMKVAPIIRQLEIAARQGRNISYRLVHTGQHYDKKMSGSFFEQLSIPLPHVNLESGSGTQAEQTAKIMTRYEKLLLEAPCDITLVVGDVTSTMACTIAAKKLPNIRVVHVEGGIRSGDLTMPEEINRIVTDSISDYFYTTTHQAGENLKKQGVSENQIVFVGNTMIDTLLANRSKFVEPEVYSREGLQKGRFIVMTLHRPGNVDDAMNLKHIIDKILSSTDGIPLVFPVHPRTAKVFSQLGLADPRLILQEPLSYLEFNYLVENSLAVITDSGGITEETTILGIPCITLRDSTERPETVTIGTNELIGTDPNQIAPTLEKLTSGNWKKGEIPELWDGQAAQRIVAHIQTLNQ